VSFLKGSIFYGSKLPKDYTKTLMKSMIFIRLYCSFISILIWAEFIPVQCTCERFRNCLITFTPLKLNTVFVEPSTNGYIYIIS